MTFLLSLLACPKQVTTPDVVLPHPLDERPVIGAAADYVPPAPQVFILDNGATVWFIEKPGLPLVSVNLIVQGGRAMDPGELPGLTSFTDDLLTHGAADLDATAFAALSEDKALTLWTSTGQATSWVMLEATRDTLDTGMELMAKAVMQPRFDAEEVSLVREQRVAELALSLDEPSTVARWVSDSLYFGEGHPLAHNTVGTEQALMEMSVTDLKDSWAARYAPERATFVVSGGISRHELEMVLGQSFGGWSSVKLAPLPEIPAPAATSGYYLVDNPAASQSVLRVVLPSWMDEDPNYVYGALGGIVLGGTFTSRLNRLLREEKGYTYGARAGVYTGPAYGRMVVTSSVRGDVTGLALVDLLAEVDKIVAGIDAPELKKAQGSTITDMVSAMESRSAIASSYAALAAMGNPPERMALELQMARDASVEQVNDALSVLDPSAALVVIVGDLSVIQPQLAEALPDVVWTVLEKTAVER